jgi:hypothetical protein
MHTRHGSIQGYNAQAVTTTEQVIVAAELTQQANDLQQLEPMLAATAATLAAAGVPQRPGRLLADCGYWSIANLTQIPGAPELLIPPARHGRQGKPRKDGKPTASRSDGLRAAMTAKLASDDGKACYAKRKETVEPVFGQLKEQQGARRFLRRGLPPARPSGSCCAAPTTSSSCGATGPGHHRPAQRPPDRDPGPDAATTASAVHQPGAAPATHPRRGRLIAARSRRLWATGSLFVNLALPVGIMVVFVYVFGGAITTGASGLDYVDFVVPAVLLLSAGYGAALTASNIAADMNGACSTGSGPYPSAAGSCPPATSSPPSCATW